MRNIFLGYYKPSPSEMQKIWDEGIIVLDTNVLLHLFRYSSNARQDFLKVMQAKRDALWIPHQVGAEFHRRRIGVINDQRRAFDAIKDAVAKASGQISATLDSYKKHPSLKTTRLSRDFDNAIQALNAKIEKQADEHSEEMIQNGINDQILDTVTALYENRVGEKYDNTTLEQIYSEGENRYAEEIPPGYRDAKKNAPAKYGDLVLWKQLLAYASDVKKPAIFVTDDAKEDWWYIVDEHRQGARPELIEEYRNASGERIHLMTSDRFLQFAKTNIKEIRLSSVTEAEHLSKYYEASQDDYAEWYGRAMSELQGAVTSPLDIESQLFLRDTEKELSELEEHYRLYKRERTNLRRQIRESRSKLTELLAQRDEQRDSQESHLAFRATRDELEELLRQKQKILARIETLESLLRNYYNHEGNSRSLRMFM